MVPDMNTRLLEIYESALDELSRTLPPVGGLSRPLLLAVPDGYHRAQIKLMVVGQETRGWGDGCAFAASDLMRCYREFDLARTYRYPGAPFWRAAHELYGGLNPHGPERAFLWSNLVKVDQYREADPNGRRPTLEVEEAVSRLGLLPQEIAVTEPDAVVFFTGPDYKVRLQETFPGVDHRSVCSVLSKLAHPELPCHTYQTYHPQYLNRSTRWGTIGEIVSLIRDDLYRGP